MLPQWSSRALLLGEMNVPGACCKLVPAGAVWHVVQLLLGSLRCALQRHEGDSQCTDTLTHSLIYSRGAMVHTCLLSPPGYMLISQHGPAVPLNAQVLFAEQALTSASSILLLVIVISCTLLMLPANVGRHKGAGRLTSVKACVGAVAHLQRDYSSYHYVDMFTGCTS